MLSYEEMKAAHKKMWTWLSLHPGADKGDWPEWKAKGGEYEACLYNCFACESTSEEVTEDGYTYKQVHCSRCPIKKWEHLPCYKTSLYSSWEDFTDLLHLSNPSTNIKEYISSLANKIANLEWKAYDEIDRSV